LVLMIGALVGAPVMTAEGQATISGGQQGWFVSGYTFETIPTSTGGTLGWRTDAPPAVDLMVDGGYFVFKNDVTSASVATSVILGAKRERVNLYAGVGGYQVREKGASTAVIEGMGVHGGMMLYLSGALSIDARYTILQPSASTYGQPSALQIVLRAQR
jgi:hypothetical protein